MIEQYIAMMKELKALGDKILADDSTTGFENWFDELDCMNDHIETSLGIFADTIGEDE